MINFRAMQRPKGISNVLNYAALLLLLHLCTINSAQALAMSKTIFGKAPRVELFFSSSEELRKRITFLKSKGVSSFNIVNKSNKDDMIQSVKDIQREFQKDTDISASILLTTA